VAVSVTLSGLAVSSTYHYALVATNAVGTTVTLDHSVRTPNPPSIYSESASPSSTSAALSASVSPSGLATTFQFHWGTTPTTDHATSSQSIGSGTAALPETAMVTGLQTGSVYYWYVTATNGAGTTTGPVKSFTAH
jgi:hypothetical protein